MLHTCFPDRFGIPRQPGMVPAAFGELEFFPPYDNPDAFVGLEQVSHLWILFVFHANKREEWKPRVRPPRLGGNRSLGVFATRSPLRPNPLGMSVVKLEALALRDGKPLLRLSGLDLLDGTPVLDIKPYVPYADSLPDARNRFADQPPQLLPVEFLSACSAFCEAESQRLPGLKALITQVLQQDPRPQYQQAGRDYGMRLWRCEVRWRVLERGGSPLVQVTDIRFAD